MSEAVAMKPSTTVKPMEVLVAGKIVSSRKHDKKFYTVVACPAKDAYSHPSFLEIRSDSRMGDPEEEGKWTIRVGGYFGRRYEYTDRATGEKRKGQEINTTLDLVE
jgi:hypothetical protein